MEFLFKKLIVWQKSVDLVCCVYQMIKAFPPEERYALTDQLRRAAVSISSNIAEGNGRSTNSDYAHFLAIARGSLYETVTQIHIARKLGYIPEDSDFDLLAEEISCMLGAMLKKYGAIHRSPSPNL